MPAKECFLNGYLNLQWQSESHPYLAYPGILSIYLFLTLSTLLSLTDSSCPNSSFEKWFGWGFFELLNVLFPSSWPPSMCCSSPSSASQPAFLS
jgi:hypothetical protein